MMFHPYHNVWTTTAKHQEAPQENCVVLLESQNVTPHLYAYLMTLLETGQEAKDCDPGKDGHADATVAWSPLATT